MMKKSMIALSVFAILYFSIIAFTTYWGSKNVRIVRTCDTLIVHDTIIKPEIKDSMIVRYTQVILPVAGPEIHTTDTLRDSVMVEIPITQKIYQDSVYTAYVSGYDATLDSLYIRHKIIKETITIREKAHRWGVGIQGGVGTDLRGITPYFGIGISYRLWDF